jgi:hypothetical protein
LILQLLKTVTDNNEGAAEPSSGLSMVAFCRPRGSGLLPLMVNLDFPRNAMSHSGQKQKDASGQI